MIYEIHLETAHACILKVPDFLSKHSLAHRFASELNVEERQEVNHTDQYLLMTGRSAITGWHQDLSGTAVCYLLLSGMKEFVVCEPDATNLAVFDKFLDSDQSVVLTPNPLLSSMLVKYKPDYQLLFFYEIHIISFIKK